MNKHVQLSRIFAARQQLVGRALRTQLQHSPSLSERAGAPVHLKLETQQPTGAFKQRGATTGLLAMSDEQRARGVVGFSTGNYGRGLAFAARAAGVRAVVCMSKLVPQNKIDGIRALGAEVRIVGDSQDEAEGEVERLVSEQGLCLLPPFDSPAVIAGQGTIGLEIGEDLPAVRCVLVPLSGGGLLAGILAAMKAIDAQIRVIGVSMNRGGAMLASLRAGHPVQVPEYPSLADSLGGGIGLDNRYTFPIIRDLVDDVVEVDDALVAAAIRHAYLHDQLVVEGAGAVGIAALLGERVTSPGTTAVVVSGRNIDMQTHLQIVNGVMPAL